MGADAGAVVIHLLSPGDPAQRTGGYLYNARLVAELRARGHDVGVHGLPGAWPTPSAAQIRAAADRIQSLPPGPLVADGLLWTGVAAQVHRAALVLVHSPLWREGPDALRASEARALARARVVVCTSARTARDLHVASPVVLEPGTDPAPAARGPGTGRLLCVATVTPRKGHDVMLDALGGVDAPWQLRCAGSRDRDPAWAARVARGADPRVTWLGDLDAPSLAAEYAAADVLVHAARFEGWGMALAEGLVRGLPLVTTPAGVLDDRGPAWLEVPPGDPEALATAVTRVLTEPGLAASLSAGARAIPLPTWDTQVDRFLAILATLEAP